MPILQKIKTTNFSHFSKLNNSLLTLDARNNCSLLDGRWLLKTIGINSSEQGLRQVHVIKTVHNLIPVALKRQHTKLLDTLLNLGHFGGGKNLKTYT